MAIPGGRLLFLTITLALAPSSVFGIAFRIPNQDPEAIARGNAFVATADNPSAIYYNPAGITQLEGHNVQVGVLNYIGINTRYEASTGGSIDTDFEVIPVPQLYYVYSPTNCALSFGIGAYAPFGLGVMWPDDSAMRPFAIESRLQYLTLNPIIAWKAHPTFSIAIGPTVNYSSIMFTRGLLDPTADFYKFKGNDLSFGFNAGLLWQPHEQWSFGANYRSASTMNYEGDSNYKNDNAPFLNSKVSTKARVPFPQIFSAGVSFRPTPKWNVEANVDYTDWNPLKTITLKGTSNLGGGGVFPDLQLGLNFHESWFYELGVTRYLDNGWFVSGGYFFCSETSPDNSFTPAIPDTELHVGSIGCGRKGERWSWAVAAQIIAGPERSISTIPNAPSGTYQLFIPTLSVSVAYRF